MAWDLVAARESLHQLAVQVLGRRRHDVTGRFGLRPTPDGFGTPAFGSDQLEVIRLSGRFLVVERGPEAVVEPVSTLRRAAELVGVELDPSFSVGPDTPPLRDPDSPLDVDDGAARRLASWWGLGLTIIDEVEATDAEITSATNAQLWPEHFDLGCAVDRGGERINLGASPGDSFSDDPYLYVGPWSPARPGDAAYWNAPFGATLTMATLDALAPDDRATRARAFFSDGLSRF